jgi:hypothetical protein
MPEPPAPHSSKLQQVVVDMDQLSSSPEAAAAFRGADAVFCALGTTRGVRGLSVPVVLRATQQAAGKSCAAGA